MRRTLYCALVGWLVAAGFCAADTIEPTSGAAFTGTVIRYAKGSFDIQVSDGSSHSYTAGTIKRVTFDPRPTPASVSSVTKGALQGTVSSYSNGDFTIEDPAGSQKIPGMFVNTISFGPGGATARGNPIEVITKGATVNLNNHLVQGHVTIVDFYADWCGPCKMLSPTLEQLARTDPDVALRKIDIINWSSPVSKQFGINSIPHVEVYNRSGKLVGTVSGVFPDQVRQYVAQAKSGG